MHFQGWLSANCFLGANKIFRETTAEDTIIQLVENLPRKTSKGKLKVKNEKKSTFCDSNGSS